MKKPACRVNHLIVAVAFLLGVGCAEPESSSPDAQATPRDADADHAAVESAVRTHWSAINMGDTATVGRQHSADLTLILADLGPRVTMTSPELQPLLTRWTGATPAWTVEDLQVQLFGDVAVATLYLGGQITWADGSADSRRRRVTEVWARQLDGTWLEAHHHDSVFTQ